MPKDLPPWAIIGQQAWRWFTAGVFESMACDLRFFLRISKDRKALPSTAIFDSRTLPSTPLGGHRIGYDGAKRRKGSKIRAAVDTRAIYWHITSRRPTSRIARKGRSWRRKFGR